MGHSHKNVPFHFIVEYSWCSAARRKSSLSRIKGLVPLAFCFGLCDTFWVPIEIESLNFHQSFRLSFSDHSQNFCSIQQLLFSTFSKGPPFASKSHFQSKFESKGLWKCEKLKFLDSAEILWVSQNCKRKLWWKILAF